MLVEVVGSGNRRDFALCRGFGGDQPIAQRGVFLASDRFVATLSSGPNGPQSVAGD
jgi:hypothetical protein